MRQTVSRATTFLLAALFAVGPLAAMAAGTTGVVTGVVRASSGAPLGGAAVELTGPNRLATSTDAHGTFTFPNVPTGMYSLQVSKAGYNVYRNDSVVAFIGETTTESIILTEASFNSLKTIGAVSTNAAGVAPLNTSTAAIDTISSTVFDNQGADQVAKVLNETPGIFTTPYSPATVTRATADRPARSRRRRFAARFRTRRSRSSTVTPFRSVPPGRTRPTSSTRSCFSPSNSSRVRVRCRSRSTTPLTERSTTLRSSQPRRPSRRV